MLQTVVAIWVSFVMLFVNFVPGFILPADKKAEDKSYPYIFVHGFLGWGEDEGIDGDFAYWGATSCHLIPNLNKEGYTCYDASVGPISSNWDRACELYAQLTGTTVDYGVAHSKKCNHLRYGRKYDKPLIENWGELDENGLINKVNLIGHSFGGNTVRLLVSLLSDGCQDEINATDSNDISPLFTGGKSEWVNSLITICSPNNGTTMAYIADKLHLTEWLTELVYTYAGVMGRSPANGYVDFHLEQFGLTNIPGERTTKETIYKSIQVIMKQKYDNFAYDMSPDGATEANKTIDMEDNIYYFSYTFSTTYKGKITGNQLPLPSTLGILIPFSTMMGAYKKNTDTKYPIDENWLENDGLVNVISAKYPFDDAHMDYNSNNIQPGIWNVMPLSTGDHGTAIGIGTTEASTMEYYNGMISMVESLPIIK
jgi:triacylglycerol lipase